MTTFPVGQLALAGLTLICKVPLIYVAACTARVYYVFGAANMTSVCLHLGVHDHPVKVVEDQVIKETTR